MRNIIILTAVFIFIHISYLYAEDGFTQRDRELLIGLTVKMQEIDKRFEMVDKRIDDVNRRFDDMNQNVNQRFDDVNRKFDDMHNNMNNRFGDMFNYFWILAGIFTSFTITVIGFAFWDRSTMINKAKKETIEEIEKSGLSVNLLNVLRKIAQEDSKLADVLRQFHLI